MSSLDNNPFWCEKHGFTEVITSKGVGSVLKNRCPFCRAETAEATISSLTELCLNASAGSLLGVDQVMRIIKHHGKPPIPAVQIKNPMKPC